MKRIVEDALLSGNNRRNFLKRLSGGILGGSLLAGTSLLQGQEKKGATTRPRGITSPAGIMDSSPLTGQVCLFAFNVVPAGWLRCDGALVSIGTYTELFEVVGTMYGGDGVTTFGLPNLQGVLPIGAGSGNSLTTRNVGDAGGEQTVTLTNPNIPSHTHTLSANSGAGTSNTPQGNFFASNAEGMGQFSASANTTLNADTLTSSGSGGTHNNMPPYLALNFCIATTGTFPSHTGTSPNMMYGDILLFAGNFIPAGYLACDGSLLSIATNDTLFSLIGTTYGGNGTTNFAVPDLRGRAPIHVGSGFSLGQFGGTETETLTTNQIPSHSHSLQASTDPGSSAAPGSNYPAANLEGVPQFSGVSNATMSGSVLASDGGSTSHNNMPPFLALTYCIGNAGTFP